MKTLLLSLLLASPFASSPAHALGFLEDFPGSCTFDVNGQKAELDLTMGQNNVYSGRFFIGKTELNPLGTCHESFVPGRRGVRCTFTDGGKNRYEIYPDASTASVRVIVWTGDQVAAPLNAGCQK